MKRGSLVVAHRLAAYRIPAAAPSDDGREREREGATQRRPILHGSPKYPRLSGTCPKAGLDVEYAAYVGLLSISQSFGGGGVSECWLGVVVVCACVCV